VVVEKNKFEIQVADHSKDFVQWWIWHGGRTWDEYWTRGWERVRQ